MSWPMKPFGEEPEDRGNVVLGRMANIMVPVTLLDTGKTIKILCTMPEAHARAIVNMHPDQARSMGPFFEVIKEHMTEFIEREG